MNEQKKKETKERAKNYDQKLAVKGTFEQLVNVAVKKPTAKKPE